MYPLTQSRARPVSPIVVAPADSSAQNLVNDVASRHDGRAQNDSRRPSTRGINLNELSHDDLTMADMLVRMRGDSVQSSETMRARPAFQPYAARATSQVPHTRYEAMETFVKRVGDTQVWQLDYDLGEEIQQFALLRGPESGSQYSFPTARISIPVSLVPQLMREMYRVAEVGRHRGEASSQLNSGELQLSLHHNAGDPGVVIRSNIAPSAAQHEAASMQVAKTDMADLCAVLWQIHSSAL